MSVNITNEQNNIETKQIEGVLFALMKELKNLASHPDKPRSNGPDFVQVDSAYEPAAEYDGMLGSMVMDSMLGGAFTMAAEGVNWGDIIECASNFLQDRSEKPFQVGQKKALSGSFNRNGLSPAARAEMLSLYMSDLPRRLGMERWIAESQRKLYALQKHAALGLAA